MGRRYRTLEEKKKKSTWWGEGAEGLSVPQESGSVIGGFRRIRFDCPVKTRFTRILIKRPLDEIYNDSIELQWHREIVWWSQDRI